MPTAVKPATKAPAKTTTKPVAAKAAPSKVTTTVVKETKTVPAKTSSTKKDPMTDPVENIKDAYANFIDDFTLFTEKGNNAAGTRARAALQRLKVNATGLRPKIQERIKTNKATKVKK